MKKNKENQAIDVEYRAILEEEKEEEKEEREEYANFLGKSAQKNKKLKKWLMWTSLLVLIIILLLVLTQCSRNGENTNTPFNWDFDQSAEQGGEEEIDYEKIQEELNEKVRASMLRIKIASEATINTASDKVRIAFINHEDNHYYQIAEIKIKDTDKVILKTGAIKPGQRILESYLSDKTLKAGFYDCITVIYAIDPETNEKIGQQQVVFKLTINN